jgi:hypothetical protein
MKTKFTKQQIAEARNYWKALTLSELIFYWKHYTAGKGRGIYTNVYPDTSFADYLVESAAQSSFDRANDI